MEQSIIQFLKTIINEVLGSLIHNWFPLTSAILIAAVLKTYINPAKLRNALSRSTKVSIFASVAAGAFTPLCACGTSAVIIAMATTALPWAPIMAFLTSSPLMSPEGFIMLAGIINLNFAIALTTASIIIGLGSGFITHLIEKRTNFLNNQIRFTKKSKLCATGYTTLPIEKQQKQDACACTITGPIQLALCCGPAICCTIPTDTVIRKQVCENELNPVAFKDDNSKLLKVLQKIRWKEILKAIIDIGLKKILLFYSLFVAVGYLINLLVPTDLIVALFSSGNVFAVPLAGLVGFPIYISGESAIPLINTLMSGGASSGAMLAFMITGPGTSAWVIAGISTFMKKRAVSLYIIFLLTWGIVLGYFYDFIIYIF